MTDLKDEIFKSLRKKNNLRVLLNNFLIALADVDRDVFFINFGEEAENLFNKIYEYKCKHQSGE